MAAGSARRLVNPTGEEVLRIVAARALRGKGNCFVGIGAPSAAANLARRVHNPDLVLIYESGTIGAKPTVLPLSIGDGELAETADTVVSIPEIFAYWLQAGRIDVGFLGAAQIDRFGRLNSTVIGAYDHPTVRLPGAGGAPEIAAAAREVMILLRHRPEAFVEVLDFVTSVGRPASVFTDLGVLVPDAATGELTLSHVHPGVTVDQVRKATGWPLRVAMDIQETEPATEEELRELRDLEKRSARAHHARRREHE
jgi:glutaconate CoA-transferase, subunit B